MALSIENLGEIDEVVGQWCLTRVPPELKKKVDYDYEVEDQAVTFFEVRPALAGSAAAVVGLVPHHDAVNLGWMMLGFAVTVTVAQYLLRMR